MYGDESKRGRLAGFFSGIGDRIRGRNYSRLVDGAKSTFGFIANPLKKFAQLDPEGFGRPRLIKVPMVVSQVVDRQQPCVFLPTSSIKQEGMWVNKGLLVVDGHTFPIMPIADTGVERVTTHDNKQLYAINTNQTEDAFKILGLNPSRYKNKRLVIACEGYRVVPIGSSDKDPRLMRVVCNPEVNPETRRIKNEVTGDTMWLPTLLIALPFNLCAGLLEVAAMIVHSSLNVVVKGLNKGASYFEEKARHLSIARDRGTVTGASRVSALFCVFLGSVLRGFERLASALSCFLGCVRTVVRTSLKAVPLAVNAMLNPSSGQSTILKHYVMSAFSECSEKASKFRAETAASARLYGSLIKGKASDISESHAEHTVDTGADKEDIHANAKSREVQRGPQNLDNKRDSVSAAMGEDDLKKIRAVGKDLTELGVVVGYGPADSVLFNFMNGGRLEKEAGVRK
ncbi:hypothetical protein [Anaplasma phagocytophilum]|uniref:Uncharacterized protein n=3 Tax=Anaplasma phagocytophilum TaxID=948 RepID=Q2GJ92_ANAPZ|nr:hypothetical protein [Anaplasma phagocytophilum]KJZ98945.1 hypothetical protein APHCR_0504 [Anaplasma phagocytophilum str. CR1007]ABD43754.1 hypothetical protein APH_0997 [Anaplasma phagocytophilum str. HZ]AGR79592.1 hypothetical protein YYU_04570 [Anaplasma phagocytophilum str. HZ2]AGR80847.1 hypothetical protein WSQ_04600 [Anaplasma phagocytophilum str. JM]AGR82100.1 hypothetical protein YYY_04595 [Anaplasma phagocytophilum str. Dog2]